MGTYNDAVNMTTEELINNPEVELCACAHPRGLHSEIAHICHGSYVKEARMIGKPAVVIVEGSRQLDCD